ncbi:MAG: hypothetical protein H8E13_22665 [Actinobacteria bacterium]|nr:hypothetical protein [Actinomycetota bacterium]
MKRIYLKRFLVISLSIVVMLGLIPFTTSCAPELSFRDLVICEDINQDTFEPVNAKNEFDIKAKNICACIEYFGVKGGDSYRFNWINTDTGEDTLDKTGEYAEGESGYFDGCAYSSSSLSGDGINIPPGNYKVDFYHNGELMKTANFIVKKPEVKISEVSLANQVGEDFAPINKTQQFSPTEIIYACIRINYFILGNSLKAKWYDNNGNLIVETVADMDEDLYEPMWADFSFEGEDGYLLPGGYNVEIYLNDNLYGTYDFEIINTYSNDKYGVLFAVPDNWTYTEIDDADSLEVNLVAPSEDLPVAFLFMVSSTGDYPPKEQLPEFADEMNSEIAVDNNWELIDTEGEELVSNHGIPYRDFVYIYNDPDNNEWATVTAFFENNNRLYVLFTTVRSDYYNIGQPIYYSIIDSLQLD